MKIEHRWRSLVMRLMCSCTAIHSGSIPSIFNNATARASFLNEDYGSFPLKMTFSTSKGHLYVEYLNRIRPFYFRTGMWKERNGITAEIALLCYWRLPRVVWPSQQCHRTKVAGRCWRGLSTTMLGKLTKKRCSYLANVRGWRLVKVRLFRCSAIDRLFKFLASAPNYLSVDKELPHPRRRKSHALQEST